MASLPSEFATYIGRVREFKRRDWLGYLLWVGTILGTFFTTGGFLLVGRANGVHFPSEAWLVPIGALGFALATAVDTIGHRTIYKQALTGGEDLVHQITIACGIISIVFLILAYEYRACAIPALVFTALSYVYSMVDEWFHWRRYVDGDSDRVEMWSHVGIFSGHSMMMLAWWWLYFDGYPGVAETLAAMPFT